MERAHLLPFEPIGREPVRLSLGQDVGANLPAGVVDMTMLARHVEQAATRVVVLLVILEVFGKTVDAFGQECHLDLGRTRVLVVGPVRLDGRRFDGTADQRDLLVPAPQGEAGSSWNLEGMRDSCRAGRTPQTGVAR